MLLHSIQHGPSQAIYAAIKLIENASDTVLLSTFVLEGQGHAGKCLMDAIIKTKASKIKLLSNHHSLFSQKTLNYLSLFPCISEKLEIRVWKHRFMNSNHAKFVIVDDEICSLGGYNFQEVFFMEEEFAWSDLGIVITSTILASKLKKYFYKLWYQSEIIECDLSLEPNNYKCPLNAKGKTLLINQNINEFSILTQIPKKLFLHSHESKSFQAIMKCFASATKSIDILSPNVIDSCIWYLLIDKLKSIKNFQIRIITNKGHNNSQSFVSLLKEEKIYFCEKKLEFKNQLHIRFANGHAKENQTIHLETDGRNCPVYIDHSKYFCVDLQHFYIGSFNMDTISMHACGETGIIIYNEKDLTLKINTFLFEPTFLKATPIDCFAIKSQ